MQLLDNQAPAVLLPWLTHTQSLTEKLQQIVGETTMKVCTQEWVRSWWSQQVLGLANTPLMQREIVMYAQGQACWYARTLIPAMTWEENKGLFEQLSHLSLGKLIFNPQNAITRNWLKHYAIDAQMLEFHWPQPELVGGTQQLWMRLSQFAVARQHSFYLAEILLPGLLEVSQ